MHRGKWRKLDGTMMKISEMTVDHIENVMIQMKEHFEKNREIMMGSASDAQAFLYENLRVEDMYPKYSELAWELAKRKAPEPQGPGAKNNESQYPPISSRS